MPLKPMPSKITSTHGSNFPPDIDLEDAVPATVDFGDDQMLVDFGDELLVDDDEVLALSEGNVDSMEDFTFNMERSEERGEFNKQEYSSNAAEVIRNVLTDRDVTEISIQGANRMFVRKKGTNIHVKEFDAGTTEEYHTLLNQVLISEVQGEAGIKPIGNDFLIEYKLPIRYPDGSLSQARTHILTPPITPQASVTIAKRPKNIITISDMIQGGTMSEMMGEFLLDMVRHHKTIVVAGGSGAGKTTLLTALGYQGFRDDEKIIVIEDLPELDFRKDYSEYLHTTPEKPGLNPNRVTMDYLVRQTKRMRPERVIIGEVRGPEITSFLDVATSGVQGCMNTLHAESPQETLNKIVDLAMSGGGIGDEGLSGLKTNISKAIDIIVQAKREEGKQNGRHLITEISQVGDTVNNGVFGLTQLFRFNADANRFEQSNTPDGKLREDMILREMPSCKIFNLH